MMTARSIPAAAMLAALTLAGAARADVIATGQISPSADLPFFSCCGYEFTLDQINDGITADFPFNGFAANGIRSGRITLALDQAYNLESFTLWNDINVSNEGVRTFQLSFEDASGNLLGSTGTLSAVSQLAPQVYTFGSTVMGVSTVQLDVLTSNLQIEIREVAFNGVAVVPEPGTLATMLAGLGALGFVLRRRRG